MNQWIVGLDYSMTCPAITITKADVPFGFDNCELFYLAKKNTRLLPNVTGSKLAEYESNEERFDLISDWAVQCIQKRTKDDLCKVIIEDYSYGSTGKVFNIAENSGLIKHKLWKLGYPITAIPPKVIKKFASKNGNATKDQMYTAFVIETGVELMKVYQPKAQYVGSPVGDLVDSYFICKLGRQ